MAIHGRQVRLAIEAPQEVTVVVFSSKLQAEYALPVFSSRE
jgi:sRNA-binding carbon storage regulator CsrA